MGNSPTRRRGDYRRAAENTEATLTSAYLLDKYKLFSPEKLRCFIAASECGSIRKAGVEIGAQESSVSRRIRDLEDELGASLFIRRSGGVTLTVAGERLLPRARMILRYMAEAAEDVAAVGRSEKGLIRIGASSSLASGFLPMLLHKYRQDQPGLEIRLVDGNRANHLISIRALQIDAAFVPGRASSTDCSDFPIWSERLVLALGEDHPLAARDRVSWADLAAEILLMASSGPDLHIHVRHRIAELDVRPQSVSRDSILSLVAMGWGVALDTEAAMANRFPGVVWLPIGEETIQFSAVWLTQNDNPALRRLLSSARELSRA